MGPFDLDPTPGATRGLTELGWPFLVAELLGGVLLIAIMFLLVRLTLLPQFRGRSALRWFSIGWPGAKTSDASID